MIAPSDIAAILLHVLDAMVAGAVIGLEYAFHGRSVGFRIYGLVALASMYPHADNYLSRGVPLR